MASETIYTSYDRTALKKWNWGAFALTPFWALRHGLGVWFILSILPGVGVFAAFYMGWYGNRLAFEKSRERSINRFMENQDSWRNWGIGYLVIIILVVLVGLIIEI